LIEIFIAAVVIAIVASALGFRGVASGAATVAKVIAFIFIILALLLLIFLLIGIDLFR
jgi:uncharacterized membrane protein YtjA (UPF0391 family)